MDLGVISQNLQTGKPISLKNGNEFLFANTSDLLGFKSYYGKAICFTENGNYEAIKTYSEMVKYVSNLQGWIQTASGLRINLNRIVAISPIGSNDYELISDCGKKFPLNPAYSKRVKKYFEVKNLQHITPISLPQYWMMKMNIRDIKKTLCT